MTNFKQLKVWQKAFAISLNNFKITATFPPNEKFGLVSQINRAGVSIPSNIAEGSSRSSQKEYKHFIPRSQIVKMQKELVLKKQNFTLFK